MEWLEAQQSNPVVTTHEHITTELGTSRIVISRVPKELEQQGKVTLHRGKLTF